MDGVVVIVLVVALVLVGLVVGATWALTRAAQRRRRELEESGELDRPGGLRPPG